MGTEVEAEEASVEVTEEDLVAEVDLVTEEDLVAEEDLVVETEAVSEVAAVAVEVPTNPFHIRWCVPR